MALAGFLSKVILSPQVSLSLLELSTPALNDTTSLPEPMEPSQGASLKVTGDAHFQKDRHSLAMEW